MSEEYKDLTKSEEQAAKPVQPMPQPVQQVFYDPYIYRLQHEQPVVVRTEPKKPSAAKKFFLLVGGAILFGALAGGAFIGVKALDEKFGKKEEAPTEESAEGTNELDVKKPKTGIVLQTSKDVGETSVSAVDVSAVAESAMPSVVAINNYSKQTYSYFFYDYESDEVVLAGSGSGIIIGQNDKEVLIVTNFHVVDGAERLSVQFVDGTTADAAVKGSASSSDLAVLAVKFEDLSDSTVEAIRVARLGSSDDVKVGEIAIAVGNALGYGQSVTVGYISAKERKITIDKMTYTLIQTDAAINPGNSGGALLNKNGEVIGINSAKYEDYKVEGMGFAIPISNILSLINELSNREEIKEEERAYLGIERGTDITDDMYAERFNIPKGLYVNAVAKGSAAEKAGIRQGDIIVRMDSAIIYGMSDLQEFLSYTKAGTEVEIVLYRSNQGVYEEMTINVTLDKRPRKKS
ncbi:MAG: trypsin-like peptidase domain-containing protein [Lachnospiraceae bacterium]|nr:trypsin-like peptidase domain-containing protein [Lachnospiraceae bacterium]